MFELVELLHEESLPKKVPKMTKIFQNGGVFFESVYISHSLLICNEGAQTGEDTHRPSDIAADYDGTEVKLT